MTLNKLFTEYGNLNTKDFIFKKINYSRHKQDIFNLNIEIKEKPKTNEKNPIKSWHYY